MSREILKDIIEDFSTEKFIHFFRNKNTSFRPMQEDLSNYNDGDFTSSEKIGEIEFQDNNLIICAFQVLKDLTERSGKKKQYELGKRILKDSNADAGIFIFYDQNGNFRFSLIYTEYFGTKRKFSYFKRFTYFVGAIRELPLRTNKTFLEQIGEGDFSSLEKIKEAFSVEPVTKQFYQEIANWYFWAVKNVRFPDDAEKEPNGRNIAVIRLITRIIFIWFMKERNLIPDELFNENLLGNILKNFTLENDNYYKAILQNLFFATLNTRQKERRFRSDKRSYTGYNTDFGNHNVYRYENLFKDSEEAIEKYFLPIPFLNGGLFECLDYKSKNKEERKYIDGFTDLKKYQPQVPNYLFFDEEEIVDLSEDYNDTKYRRTKVKGLIKTLSQYNFTIDENEPDDIEIALDPELLGKVFENLLASYNPETATTARKATGSYYTPREIVDYMVDESLKEYFKTHIPEIEEEKLNKLFTKEDSTNPFDIETTIKLINLIDALRIVDPAVGSGAFPMRVLSRLVFLLHKLDPDNSQWKKIQIDGILKSVKDPILQKELINQVEKRFKEKNPDYGRKLYLIEKCIYGVDIQQIAVEIAKLRFFISLLVDEAIDFDKKDENYGIEPLPNLDFKIMQGNSLISSFYGIYFKQEPASKSMLFELDERYKQLISEFEELKSQYQNEPDVIKKQDLRKKIDEKIVQIFEEKLNEHLPEIKQIEEKAKQFQKQNQRDEYVKLEKEKLFKRLGINLEKAKEDLIAYTEARKEKNFFLWDIYFAEVFAEKSGFDIVIGNPPHGADISKYKDYVENNFKFFETRKNSASLFIEKSFELLKQEGVLAYVIPKSITFVESWEKTRDLIYKKNRLLVLTDITKAFENVKLEQIILICQETRSGSYFYKTGDFWDGNIRINTKIKTEIADKLDILPLYTEEIKMGILNKLLENSVKLYTISKTFRGLPYQNKVSEDGYPILRGKNINKYLIYREIDKVNLTNSELNSPKVKQLMKPKIISQNIVAHVMNPFDRIIIMATYDKKGFLTLDTVMNTFLTDNSFSYEYILGILNSRLAEWFYYWFVYNRAIRTMHFDESYIGKLPIKKITSQNEPIAYRIIEHVNKILSHAHSSDYEINQQKQTEVKTLEQQINNLVYKLYNLAEEEIKLIEGGR